MSHVSPNTANSVKPTEHTDSHGSESANRFKQSTPPEYANTTLDVNSLSQTSCQCQCQIQTSTPPDSKHKFFEEIRGWLMIVAILAAGSTYQAGLNPPGGIWSSDGDTNGRHYEAGTPVLHDKFFNRYQVFFYCNAISFLSSLAIIIVLLNKTFYENLRRITALEIIMVLDLFSFMAAYAVGSCRRVSSSIYVFLLMGGVFIYVMWFAWVWHPLIKKLAACIPCTWLRTINTKQHQDSNNV